MSLSLAAFTVALVGGVAGSGHCVGMCGPFAGFAGTARRGAWDGTAAYQLGRATAYLGLGVVAGVFGEVVGKAASMFELQRVLAVLTGVSLVVIGASYLFAPRRLGRFGRIWARWVAELAAFARRAGPRAGPYLLGLSASLLPCGFLYTFAVAAAATGTLAGALLTMSGFWLGTAPALVATAWLAGRVGDGMFRHARKLVGVSLIVLGVLGVVGRWGSPPAEDGKPSCCHHAAKTTDGASTTGG
ncbi:MAG: sulfite exporter TauE/SafE family protein [Deltaproteobacteria bacterium]|nr:sulfite exporter TauE/SafE family protein [Deltaproteobacteria bacterium]